MRSCAELSMYRRNMGNVLTKSHSSGIVNPLSGRTDCRNTSMGIRKAKINVMSPQVDEEIIGEFNAALGVLARPCFG